MYTFNMLFAIIIHMFIEKKFGMKNWNIGDK